MNPAYSYQLRHDENGRIIEKTESVSGRAMKWTYAYDKEGRLTKATLDNRLICECHYDKQGRRFQDYFPLTHGRQMRSYAYRLDNRLMSAGNNGYTHDAQGFRSIWNNEGKYTTYTYSPDHRLLEANKEDEGIVFEFSHDGNGQREVKYRNGEMVEAYQWLDLIRLAGFHDGEFGYRFAYDGEERTPCAMQREDGAVASLHYDQVGSLRVVADESGNVIQEILYDPFGGIIEDSNPNLRIPIGFAGGLHDRDLGFVRFGWRDYDTFIGRWTAPDPMGDAGGDSDWYGYCLDDPVNGVDPLGLWTDVVYYSGNMGHVAVAPGGGAPRGKYPQSKKDILGGKGVFKEETGKAHKTVRLDTSSEQEQFMKEYLRMAKESPSVQYDVIDNNCVKGVCDVLDAGGVKTPKGVKGIHPGAFMDKLKRMKK